MTARSASAKKYPLGSRDQRGISIIEVMISFTVLVLIMVPLSNLLLRSLKDANDARTQTTALGIAEEWIEKLNNVGPPTNSSGFPQVGIGISEGNTVESGTTYSVTALFNWTSENGNVDLCTTGVVPEVLNLVVTVHWKPSQEITDTTIIDFPPAGVPINGFIGVQIDGNPSGSTNPEPQARTGRPWGGVSGRVTTVQASATSTTGSLTYFAYADANGCAFFEAKPGTYNVKVSPNSLVTPFVAPGLDVTSESSKVTVVTNQVSQVGPYLCDEGSYISLAYPNSTTADGLVTCPNIDKVQCFVTGQVPLGTAANGSSGMSPAISVLSGSVWQTSQVEKVADIARVTSIACASLCVGIGYSDLGAPAAITMSALTPLGWSASPLPQSVKALSQITCPTQTSCLAIGTSTRGALVLGGAIEGGTVTWSIDNLPLLFTKAVELACPSSTACVITGTGLLGGMIISGTASGSLQTWIADSLPLSISSFSTLVCPNKSFCEVVVTSLLGAAVIAAKPLSASITWVLDTLASGVSSISQLVCPDSTVCLGRGIGSSGPVIVAGKPSLLADSFVKDTLPAFVTSVEDLACGTTGCVASVDTATGEQLIGGPAISTPFLWVSETEPPGVVSITNLRCPLGFSICLGTDTTNDPQLGGIIAGLQSPTSQTYQSASLSNPAVFLSGLSCFSHAGTLSCASGGASETNAEDFLAPFVTFTKSTLIATFGATVETTLSGLYATSLPISALNSASTQTDPLSCSTCTSKIGPLFPFASGYSVGAGNCLAELGQSSAHITSVPGTTLGNSPRLTVPLGLLTIQVESGGTLDVGAKVTLEVSDPDVPANAACNGLHLSLGDTDHDGYVALDVMFETYTILVNGTAVEKIEVTPSTVVTSPDTASATIVPLPVPLEVSP